MAKIISATAGMKTGIKRTMYKVIQKEEIREEEIDTKRTG